uniref:Ig-like domain-containing protein n=1 Tax=Dicentrarchus labrax TaxID=13489 RepID=A0A8P4KFU3_DICLA
MIVICVTMLLFHQGHTLIPVTTAQLGEPATFTCVLPDYESNPRQFHWYKQSVGDSLKLILVQRKGINPVYGPEFSASRLDLNIHKNISKLTILRTIQEDEGMYHCALVDYAKITWSGTYLSITGNTLKTSNYTVVQWPTVSDPVHPEDSMTLQCSVLSDSDNKTCPGDHSVFWFRAGSDQSHPNIIYTDGNRHDECEKRSNTQKSCVYRFTKNISSSDAGTYYCAVATCGEILFGNGTKVEIVKTTHSAFITVVILSICLAISVVGNVVLICNQNVHEQYKGMENDTLEAGHDSLCQPVHDTTEAYDKFNYVEALNFSTRGRKKSETAEDSVYSHVTYNVI